MYSADGLQREAVFIVVDAERITLRTSYVGEVIVHVLACTRISAQICRKIFFNVFFFVCCCMEGYQQVQSPQISDCMQPINNILPSEQLDENTINKLYHQLSASF